MSDKIKEKYIAYVLENGTEPESIYKFAKSLKIKEEEFYEKYNSFKQIQNDIWKEYFTETIMMIQKEEVYAGYSVREKLLAFFYTLIETLKSSRSFVLKSYETLEQPLNLKSNPVLADAKKVFIEFAGDLMMEGRETREVESRPIPQIANKYPDLMWTLCLSIIDFWIKDYSKLFEKTDTLIEKSVNTAMDWIGRNPLDSLLDLGKFLFQNRK